MFRNFFKLFLLSRLFGGGRGGGRRSGGIGCLGLIVVLVIIYFLYQYFAG